MIIFYFILCSGNTKLLPYFQNVEDSDGSPDSEIDAFKKIAFSDMGSAFEIEKYGYDVNYFKI